MSVSTMKKLTVLAYSGDADAIVRKLMRLRCVQIQSAPSDDRTLTVDRLQISETLAKTEERLSAIRAAIPVLAKYSTRRTHFGRLVHRVDRDAFQTDGRADRAWQTVQKALEIRDELERISNEETKVRSLTESLEPWLEYDLPLNDAGSRRTVTLLGSYPAEKDFEATLAELEAIPAHVENVSVENGTRYVAVTCLREDAEATERTLTAHGFLRAVFPPDVRGSAQFALNATGDVSARLQVEREGTEELLKALADELDEVEILDDVESTNRTVCLQKQKLATTRNCVILEGWVPEFAEGSVLSALSSFECATELAAVEEGDEPPVLLKNNRFAQNFEWVIGMYSYPKYGTYDPTFIMSIFYFLIFGLMFADVGYGLLLTLGCIAGIKLLNPKAGMRRMLSMFAWCGVSCALMGVLFGGWFGNLPTAVLNSFVYHAEGAAEQTAVGRFFANGLLFTPITSSTSFLLLALGVGEIHLITGMAINLVQVWKSGRRAEAICSTVPYWILFAGLDLLVPGAVADMVVPDPASISETARASMALLGNIGSYLAIAGFVLILLLKGVGQRTFLGWLSKGLGGWYSLISYASDLLSYSRILALGLVAGVIAQVVNMMTGMGASGPIGFVIMLVVLIFGHILNIAINLLGTFVHAARLQYIEFFGKFYTDGGEPFDPLLPVEEYSEDIQSEAK